MKTQAVLTPENKRQSVANVFSQKQSSSKEPAFQLEDNRPGAIQMRKLQEIAIMRLLVFLLFLVGGIKCIASPNTPVNFRAKNFVSRVKEYKE